MKHLVVSMLLILILASCGKEDQQPISTNLANVETNSNRAPEEPAMAKPVSDVQVAEVPNNDEEKVTKEVEEVKPTVEEKTSSEVMVKQEAAPIQEAPKKPVVKKAPAPAKKKGARIYFPKKSYSFGRIKEGDKIEHSFTFKNTGDEPLEILSVDVTCGCTTPSYSFMPFAPGETGKIDVTFDSKNKIGRQKPTVTVLTNTSPATQKLFFEGYVEYVPLKEQAAADSASVN